MDRKTAAQKLLQIADAIDKEASENSFFVCHACNHTASLATINGRRSKTASEQGVKDVEAVDVNDTIACPACGGDMRYVPTEMSEKYYVEAADEPLPPPETDVPPEAPVEEPVDEEPKGKPKTPPKPPAEAEKAEEPEDIFKPVDEQGDTGLEDEDIDLDYEGDEDTGEDEGEALEEPEVPEDVSETPPAEGEAPVEDVPPAEGEAPTNMGPIELEPPKPPKKKKDRPDDGKPSIPKAMGPKFEFPKKAVDAEFLALAKSYME